MLLGNADVDHSSREFLGKRKQSGAARHGRCNDDEAFVLLAKLNQRLPENIGVHRVPNGF
ncbi:hypothetical protein D3C71_1433890 [compost metagenome]